MTASGGIKGALYAGTIAGRPTPRRRTDQPVWRGSLDVDDPRAKVERPLGDGTPEGAKEFIRAWIIAAKDYANHTKARGKAHRISANLIRLIETIMWRCLERATGRCEVTLERIMDVTGYSRPTVVRLLARGREEGLIDWVRRTEKTDNAPGEGPRVKQTANAYFFEVTKLPIEAYRKVKQRLAKNPPKEYPERRGSGPVPNGMARAASKLVNGLKGAWRGTGGAIVAERRTKADLLRDATPEQAAAIQYPDDPKSQREWLEMYGQSASCDRCPESPP